MIEEDGKQPYIRQQKEGEYLYLHLQKQTLEEVQRLSGKVWTDFNAHDPGVTLADIANYILVETDYKLSFDTIDYLTREDGIFCLENFGLFPPDRVYTTAPVTMEDYRRLLFSYIPELENVWVECNTTTGGYTFKIVLSPFDEDDGKAVVKQLKIVYNSHRNLCEYLDEVIVAQSEELEFHAELEIEQGKDQSVILAQIYWVILNYLSGEVSISTPEEQNESGLSPEEWLEGSENNIRVIISQQQNTEYELYKELWKVKGIKSFSTCYLMKNGQPLTNFSGGFSLKIPKNETELKVRIRCEHTLMEVDMEKFTERLKAHYYTEGRIRTKRTGMKEYDWVRMKGAYREIFTHPPIGGEFPACYRLCPNRKQPTSFEAYLKQYDLTIEQGVQEVRELPRLLSIKKEDLNYRFSRDVYALKSRYLDFLDHLYGVESHPAWLSELDNYGETTDETLRRRMSFLRHVPYMIKNRAKARDITIPEGECNSPVVKEWFCRLLGIIGDEEHTVSNVLPGHNLRLIEKRSDKPLMDRLDAMLIDERMLNEDNVTAVTYEELATDKKEKNREYSQLRVELPIFNENRISGDLFRNGTCLDNYKIVQAKKNEYMLVFRNREKSGWTNLGRTDDKKRLNTLANIMRRYLRELNWECETIYVVETVLVEPSKPFQLLIVLPTWTLRFHTPRFREMCRELLRSIIPAHLTGTIYWLDQRGMQGFESCYKQLMRAFADNNLKDYSKQLLDVMYELLEKAVETKILDDNY